MAKGSPEVVDGAGRPIKLGAIVGQGGEGAVYAVAADPSLVAKVYHQPLSGDRADKIRTMGLLRTDALTRLTAWPTGLLMDKSGGRPVGLLMPRVANRKDIHQLYSPKSRRSEFMRADWRFLVRAATNTARAFALVHEAGCIIGDVNHGGILVGQDATVTLIDCDSFQVTHGGRRFLCEVGVETFTPPELQGRSFAGVMRNPAHDDFGLAVMTFLLLFMGRHPFAGRFAGSGDMPISRAIEEHRFAYGSRRAALQMTQPPGTPPLSIVGPQAAHLFERAFAAEATTSGRPTAREWIAALDGLEKALRQCGSNPSHWHHAASSCPWCPMEGATGVALFPHHHSERGRLGLRHGEAVAGGRVPPTSGQRACHRGPGPHSVESCPETRGLVDQASFGRRRLCMPVGASRHGARSGHAVGGRRSLSRRSGRHGQVEANGTHRRCLRSREDPLGPDGKGMAPKGRPLIL
jgi:DNA-binding helix-hairpin-helix protein with protein kinase domain